MIDLVLKAFDPAEVNFTPGERSDVSWITTDVVDNEGDVVIGKGVDYQSVYMKNPVVMACHDYQKWAVGLCSWIKPSKGAGFTGLCAKTVYDDQDPDAVRTFRMVQKGLAKGRSIGFRPPTDMQPGDWGPPTPDEVKGRPDWKDARRIIRRCVLLEYSVCPIPMNQESLTIAVAKGLELPSYLGKLGPAAAHSTETYELPPHRTLDQVAADLERRLSLAFDPARLAEDAFQRALDRARGAI